jgi:SWIM zinc finger
MKLFHDRKALFSQMGSNDAVYGPAVQGKLTRNIDAGRGLHLIPSSEYIYLVKGNSSNLEEHQVDLQEKTCTCLYFQQRQFPCKHAARAILERRDQCIHDFVHDSY